MMNKEHVEYDVLTIGDLMLDFTYAGKSENGQALFERNPGGAPANVAAQVASLGGKSVFFGSVGKDEHGTFLIDALHSKGVCTEGIVQTDQQATRLTFVYLDQDNDRFFSQYQSPRADLMFFEKDIKYEILENSKIIHFATSAILEGPIAETSARLLHYAKKSGKLISYDPNWNIIFGRSPELRNKMLELIAIADIVKISEEEYHFFFPGVPLEEGIQRMISDGCSLVTVTMGRHGCYYATASAHGWIPTFAVDVQDTTGAGDSFMGGLLYQLIIAHREISALPESEVSRMISFACACGATTATRRGSLLAMPTLKEVEDTMWTTSLLML